ncbi:MAG: hydrogenase maturation nickel metallochaperone HypA [Candidatus Heimdallarchaeota archaeon]|nr:hydrogenase maturation nickel metallochaperone HypA [Candidatus Heimdallarchaeota archaeon]
MHDKTLILPIIDDLEKLLQKEVDLEISIGNFTNLNQSMVTKFLNDINPDLFSIEILGNIKFSTISGTIQCYNCDFVGTPTKIIQDHELHTDTIVVCPECDSIQTKKIGGNQILVKSL